MNKRWWICRGKVIDENIGDGFRTMPDEDVLAVDSDLAAYHYAVGLASLGAVEHGETIVVRVVAREPEGDEGAGDYIYAQRVRRVFLTDDLPGARWERRAKLA